MHPWNHLHDLQAASYPEDEAATREKLEFRIKNGGAQTARSNGTLGAGCLPAAPAHCGTQPHGRAAAPTP